MNAALIPLIDALLPQTQCGKCGHSGCLPYAQEMSEGGAINKCPPGGSATIAALAELLNRDIAPLNPKNGREAPRTVAFIREDECIGCTKCIQACPVDAILGASKRMHTVIIDECTGCDLCVAPCPVDCIDMLPAGAPQATVGAYQTTVGACLQATTPTQDVLNQRALSAHWRERYLARTRRLEKLRLDSIVRRKRIAESAAQLLKQEPSRPVEIGTWSPPAPAAKMSQEKAKADIAAAVARAKARKDALRNPS